MIYELKKVTLRCDKCGREEGMWTRHVIADCNSVTENVGSISDSHDGPAAVEIPKTCGWTQ